MIVVSKQQIIAMHHALVMETGGLDGLRDEGLLDSAIAAPFQTFDSTELFQSVHEKAARLACGLVQITPSWMATSASARTQCSSSLH